MSDIKENDIGITLVPDGYVGEDETLKVPEKPIVEDKPVVPEKPVIPVQSNQTTHHLQQNNSNKKDCLSKGVWSRKKALTTVTLLVILFLASAAGCGYFYYTDSIKKEQISFLESKALSQASVIDELRSAVEDSNIQELTINELRSQVDQMGDKLSNLQNSVFSTGSTLKFTSGADSSWIMWLYAKSQVQLQSLYVKKGEASNDYASYGNVEIGLFDSNDNLIASKVITIYSDHFTNVELDNRWTLNAGYYYLKVIQDNGNTLQYHGSSNDEYNTFNNGILQVTGCCAYSDRNNSDSKHKHSYYEYFYDIHYKLLSE